VIEAELGEQAAKICLAGRRIFAGFRASGFAALDQREQPAEPPARASAAR
jgi:hypothetical protein